VHRHLRLFRFGWSGSHRAFDRGDFDFHHLREVDRIWDARADRFVAQREAPERAEEGAFLTRKVVIEATKSHVSHVALDGVKGNTWEETIAGFLETDSRVAAYVKNDHLGFTIPYVWEGRTHQYVPDFLVRLTDRPGDATRTLIVEVSGGRKSPGPTAVKATTARDQWCTAVNNHGGFGRWGYLEITTMLEAERVLGQGLELLRADAPIVGDLERSLPLRSGAVDASKQDKPTG
jgi:hypothetical protein